MGDMLVVWNRTISVPVEMCKVAGEALAPRQGAVVAEKLAQSSAVAEAQAQNLIADGRAVKQERVQEGWQRGQLDTNPASQLDRLNESQEVQEGVVEVETAPLILLRKC